MKALKITLLVIAGLGFIASVYNAIHEQSIYEFLQGLFPVAILIAAYFRLAKDNSELEKFDS